MICCGKTISTRFCPDCGKGNESEISELITYLCKLESMSLKGAKRSFERNAESENGKKHAARANNYRRWINAVLALEVSAEGKA